MTKELLLFCAFSVFCWVFFLLFFRRDRSRYRNCYLLFVSLLSLIPVIYCLPGRFGLMAFAFLVELTLFALLLVPFFLIFNGVVMLRKEGRQRSHLLSLALGVVILFGEAAFAALLLVSVFGSSEQALAFYHSVPAAVCMFFTVSVIYVSMAFLIFMIYTVFLQIIPRNKDFDYVIILGAGLLDGDRISRLLRDRLDKAIEIYRRDPTPPKLIPSGGQGPDETVSEAEAMRRYLLEKGIPAEDIIPEDASATTFENIRNSKRILDAEEGRKYTALVTNNYHVYRALRYCKKQGLPCTGIGSRVAFYYWPSALIREFIAIHAEPKHAVMFAAGWLLCMAGVVYILMLF